MNEEENKRSYEWLAEIVKVSVLSWSAALLTLSYMGYFQKMDPTFIASIFSGSLAGYGISRASDVNRKQKEPKVEETPRPKQNRENNKMARFWFIFDTCSSTTAGLFSQGSMNSTTTTEQTIEETISIEKFGGKLETWSGTQRYSERRR